ncbi:MAG: TIGR01777 family protein [Flavobacteriales bacterium]|nr:TIGR01777 family protein [Flavobacteriales bacterium]MBT5133214.1 TIGR01777 family protein [Flavobacteriales bacterium]
MAKVLITGGSGMIGTALTKLLLDAGHRVSHLSRNPVSKDGYTAYKWDLDQDFIDLEAFKGVDTIIHLAGSEIVDHKWTEEWKKVIVDSRVKTANLLHKTMLDNDLQIEQFISASGISYYAMDVFDEQLNEDSPAGKTFLADVCVSWEAAADQFGDCASKVVKLRIGMVLEKGLGVLRTIEPVVKGFLGAGLGTGKQSMNWIHMNDVCRMFEHTVSERLTGVYNAVGPESADNQEFMQTLADVMSRAIFLPNIPETLISLIFGQKAVLVLEGSPLSSHKIEETGFHFDYPTLNTALMSIYSD